MAAADGGCPPLVRAQCGGDGSAPACGGEGAEFHVFRDEPAPTPAAGGAPLGVTDMPTHVINLDAPPERRWAHILPQYADAARALHAVVRGEMARRAPEFGAAAADLAAELPDRFGFARELAGIAELLKVDVATLMTQQLWLETYGGCSTVVMATDAGKVGGQAGRSVPYIIRTMDWSFGIKEEDIRACTFQVKFVRGGKVLYVATTHAGYIGFITAARTGGYGVSVNYRYGPDLYGGLDVRQPAVVKRVLDGVRQRYNPITFVVRHMFENMATYDEAVAYAKAVDLMAPCYFAITGTEPGEGCLITRAHTTKEQFPVWELATDGPTCQTNSDIFTEDDGWAPTGDPQTNWAREPGSKGGKHGCHRRNLGERSIATLKGEGAATLDPAQLWQLMSVVPIRNPETVFTTSMCPATGHYVSAMGVPAEDQARATVFFKGPQEEPKEPIPCAAECGFFGTVANDGYCSVCYKKIALSGRSVCD